MPTREQPNIILITTDQERFDASGAAGPSFLRTPHTDVLERQGVRFTRAYADCPLCVPSRVSIMTGKSVWQHRAPTNVETSTIMGREETLPAHLRRLGYQTAAIGKMHFGPMRTRHGFEEMLLPADYLRQMRDAGHALQPYRHGLGQNELYPGQSTVPEAMTLTSWVAEQCLTYIHHRRDPGLPFFLWCSFSKPHPPLDPPEPYYSMYQHAPIPEPIQSAWSEPETMPDPMARLQQQWSIDKIPPETLRAARAAYYGLITQNDYNMGRVLAGLQDLGLLEDAMIVFCSDHGEYLGDHRTGAKMFMHESSAHIPMVVRLPQSWDQRMPGAACPHLATPADVFSTVVAAAGGDVSAIEGIDGRDLVAVARGQAEPREFVEATCAGKLETPSYVGLTDGRWKYIAWLDGGGEHLFDIETDPQERDNLAGQPAHEAKRAELRAELVRRAESRGEAYVKNGELIERPSLGDTEAERRNRPWPGFHSEHWHKDTWH